MTRHAAVFVPLALGLGLAAGACGSPTEPNTERVIGRIDPVAELAAGGGGAGRRCGPASPSPSR